MGAGWSPPPIEPERARIGRYLALPFRRFEIDTHLTLNQSAQLLRAVVEPRRWLRAPLARGALDFEGEVTREGFSISRVIGYRNSFLPMISGAFREHPGGTLITITMRPNWFALGFWTVWMAACLMIGAIILLWTSDVQKYRAAAFLGMMLAVGYLICTVTFAIEAAKARRILTEVLTGTRTTPAT
jgi:hypothetical protein